MFCVVYVYLGRCLEKGLNYRLYYVVSSWRNRCWTNAHCSYFFPLGICLWNFVLNNTTCLQNLWVIFLRQVNAPECRRWGSALCCPAWHLSSPGLGLAAMWPGRLFSKILPLGVCVHRTFVFQPALSLSLILFSDGPPLPQRSLPYQPQIGHGPLWRVPWERHVLPALCSA